MNKKWCLSGKLPDSNKQLFTYLITNGMEWRWTNLQEIKELQKKNQFEEEVL